MQHRSFIRHLVRISKPAITASQGHFETIVNEPYRAFENRFWCGLVNGRPHKYHDQSVLKKWRVTREVDREGQPVDEQAEEIIL